MKSTFYCRIALSSSVLVLLSIASAQRSFCQNVVQNPSASQTISQPAGTSFNINGSYHINNIQYADPNQPNSVQLAINSLPSGGTVYVPCGTYTGPTTFSSDLIIKSTCPAFNWQIVANTGNIPPSFGTIFQYTSGLTIGPPNGHIQNLTISGIQFDFQNLGNVLLLQGLQYCTLDISVVGVGNGSNAAVTIQPSGNAASNNFDFNDISLYIYAFQNTSSYAAAGLLVTGNTVPISSSGGFVTENTFRKLIINGYLNDGLIVRRATDSNLFEFLQITQSGPNPPTSNSLIRFNDLNPTQDVDANSNVIKWFSFVNIGFTYDVRLGQSSQNFWRGSHGASINIQGGTPTYVAEQIGVGIAGSVPQIIYESGTGGRAVNFSGRDFTSPVSVADSTPGSTRSANLEFRDNQSSPQSFFMRKEGSVFDVLNTSGAEVLRIGSNGDLTVFGTLSKGAGSFRIDHPLDPMNKFLQHSFVESPDMLNIYNGEVTLDSKGRAKVHLPAYFGALNRDFRYQLTTVGAYAPVFISREINDCTFEIAGGKRGIKVSWQVTGIRSDAYANAHRIQVEVPKDAHDRGHLLYSEPLAAATTR
jgi:hypothetical protein